MFILWKIKATIVQGCTDAWWQKCTHIPSNSCAAENPAREKEKYGISHLYT